MSSPAESRVAASRTVTHSFDAALLKVTNGATCARIVTSDHAISKLGGFMRDRIVAAVSTIIVLVGLSLYSLGRPAQDEQMARHEPHMSAAYGHLEQAKTELERANAHKGGHRERALQLVDRAMQEV